LANFIKILAASVGGGLVLGVGIRLGGAIASREPVSRRGPSLPPSPSPKLAERIGALENRLLGLETGLETGGAGAVASRFDVQAAELAAVRARIRDENRQVEDLGETAVRLRGELQGWLESSVATRLAEVETRLKSESERSQRQMLDAFVDSVQTRVIRRISSLEDEVTGQSAAMSELRACSLRTEQSMQKLLGNLDRIILKPPVPEEAAASPAQAPVEPVVAPVDPAPVEPTASLREPPSFVEPRRRSRWNIFG
jgi:hypothetical protein